jgi:hypothetical protein
MSKPMPTGWRIISAFAGVTWLYWAVRLWSSEPLGVVIGLIYAGGVSLRLALKGVELP